MQVLNIFHVLIAISLVAFILIQKGQGATAGAAFGSGASGTVFGARGAGNFLSRTTWVLAALYCAISMTMAVVVSRTAALPEDDLGVVGSGQVQDQPAPVIDTGAGELDEFIPADDSAESDLPSMNTASDTVDEYGVESNGGANDLPVLENIATEVIENAETQGAPAVADGSGDEEPDTDGT